MPISIGVMEKSLFEEKLKAIGHFKRRWGGHASDDAFQEMIFELKEAPQACPDCLTNAPGRHVVYQKYWGYKDRPYWRTKCVHCKTIWQKLHL